MVMDEPHAVSAFDRAGSREGPLVVQYELCARGMSKLLPTGATMLDLGSGSGRYLAYLAERRPDIAIVGLELSEPMMRLGERMLEDARLASRVRFVRGDMTHCTDAVPARLDLLSSMLALHQLPSPRELHAALRQIAAIRAASGCAVWIWDLARLQDDTIMNEWLAQEADLDPLFVRDALASEAAAWTPEELEAALEQAGLGDLRHGLSRPPMLQVHWAGARGGAESDDADVWRDVAMPAALRRRTLALRFGFKGLP
jgi:tRNA (cmo5U34)-methyltransferase